MLPKRTKKPPPSGRGGRRAVRLKMRKIKSGGVMDSFELRMLLNEAAYYHWCGHTKTAKEILVEVAKAVSEPKEYPIYDNSYA